MSRPSSSRSPPRCIGSATDGAACRAASAGSERSKAPDAAVGAGDVATADKLADESIGRLEGGCRQLAIAGHWARSAATPAPHGNAPDRNRKAPAAAAATMLAVIICHDRIKRLPGEGPMR